MNDVIIANLDSILTDLSKPVDQQIDLINSLQSCISLNVNDYHFFRVDSLSKIDDESYREILENVYSCIRYPGASLVYILKGEKNSVELYLGIARNYLYPIPSISISDISQNILKPSLESNFLGSSFSQPIDNGKKLVEQLHNYNHVGVLQGTVGDQTQEKNLFFQGIERLVNAMSGSEFCLVVTAANIGLNELKTLDKGLQQGYDLLAPLTRVSFQQGKNWGYTLSQDYSKGESKGESYSRNSTYSESKGISTSRGVQDGNVSDSGAESVSKSYSKGQSYSRNKSTNISESRGRSINEGRSVNISTEQYNRQAQQWLDYLDKILLPRVDYGYSRGGFVCNISFLTNNNYTLSRLGNVAQSIFSGNVGNQNPLQMINISSYDKWVQSIKNLQIPVVREESNNIFYSLKSQINLNGKVMIGAYVTPKELSLVAGFPQEEVVGIEFKKQVSFGLNPPYVPVIDSLPLGSLVQDGGILESKKVNLNRKDLNKHVFITGVTGSGKTTTCYHLLRESRMPFLVIEPAKTEYRRLLNEYEDLVVLTPGRDDLAPLRLNPLEMMPGETISGRVDIIKASFSASFDMEAAIPQILETAVYRCYEKMGWDINTSTHPLYENPFAPGCYPFPMLRDLLEATELVVKEQGFDERLRQDYIGSIKARLQGLLVGAKGQIFNTLRSIDFGELIRRKVVIELEEIRNGAEKSLLIAFIMTNVIQALKNEHRKDPRFRHLTLIEEAHHLLTKADPSTSSNRKQAIEMFSDMLAEVRKYGEGLIIVDQIPNKLTPEVLKNTNTKIVHKLFAEDDKAIIGNTMALESIQQEHLSKLEIGQAVIFGQGWKNSILTKIEASDKTQADIPLNDIEPTMRERIWKFYQLESNLHLLPLQDMKPIKSSQQWRERLFFSSDIKLLKAYTKYMDDRNDDNHRDLKLLLDQAVESIGDETMVIEHLVHHLYLPSQNESITLWKEKLLSCYKNSFEKKIVCKENLHTINRRKY